MTGKRNGRLVCFVLIAWLLTAGSAEAIDNIRVAHPSLSASVVCLIIANKEGYYKEEGINVEFLSIRGEIAIRTTLAGEIDFFTNAGSALAAVARNVPVKIIAVLQDKPGWDLIALPNQLDRSTARANCCDHVAGRIAGGGDARDSAQERP